MFANIIPINILQVVNERFCIESRIVMNLSFVVWKECFTVRRWYLREVVCCKGHDIAADYIILRIIYENIIN